MPPPPDQKKKIPFTHSSLAPPLENLLRGPWVITNYFQNFNVLSSQLPSFFLKSHNYYFIQETLANNKYLGKRLGCMDSLTQRRLV